MLIKQRHFKSGFTFLEVMLVLFVLSLLVSLAAPRLMGRAQEAKVTQAKLQIKNFETALNLFKLDNGFYPQTQQGLMALIKKPDTGRIPENFRQEGYLDKRTLPKDPWGSEYEYLCPGINSEFEIISYGGDAKASGQGQNADIKSWEID